MDNEHKRHGIPAANIGDLDLEALAQFNPHAANEIARLEERMNRGEDSESEFLRLCQLLYDVGVVADSEHLLRRNLEGYEAECLYKRLFGSVKEEEFICAVEAFKTQFDLQLSVAKEDAFLVTTFYSNGGPPRFDEFQLLSNACEIQIGYCLKETIEANIVLFAPERTVFDSDECLLMYFVNGVWEIVDPLDA